MSTYKDKFKADKNKIVGASKEKLGKAEGNPKLEGEGQRQNAKGHFQKAAQNIKDGFKAVLKP